MEVEVSLETDGGGQGDYAQYEMVAEADYCPPGRLMMESMPMSTLGILCMASM